eukprot:COSAG06_NODE_2151_length_7467_cov_2.755836_6_plen_207_part_00
MGTAHPELEMTIGPIPLADGVGKEVVVRYSTGLASGGKWLTDSNGRELLERTRDERPDYSLNLTEPQAANMHPIQTAIAVRQHGGGGAKLTVTPDRSQAGTSLVDGQLELLVHRRLLADDGEGAGEPLNETESYHYTGTTIHRTPLADGRRSRLDVRRSRGTSAGGTCLRSTARGVCSFSRCPREQRRTDVRGDGFASVCRVIAYG